MPGTRDMAAPITRGEMHEALETWAGAIISQIDHRLYAMEARLLAELGRHSSSNAEELSRRVSALDDRYNLLPDRVAKLEDLPKRVSRLEAKVFAPRGKRR